MSLLLSQVGAPPVVPVTFAGRLRAADTDSGQVEIRGLVRVGFAVAAAIVAVTPAIRVAPARLEQPVDLTGRVTAAQQVTATVAPATPSVRIVGRLDDVPSLTGRITSAFQVAATVTAATPAVRVTSPLSDLPPALAGRIAFVQAVTVTSATRITSTPSDVSTAIVGRVATGWPVAAATPAAATPTVRLVGSLAPVDVLAGVVRSAFSIAVLPPPVDGVAPDYVVRAHGTGTPTAAHGVVIRAPFRRDQTTAAPGSLSTQAPADVTATPTPAVHDPATVAPTAPRPSTIAARPPTILGGP